MRHTKKIFSIWLMVLALVTFCLPSVLIQEKQVLNQTVSAEEVQTATWEELVSVFGTMPSEIIGNGVFDNPYQINNAVDFAIVSSLINRRPDPYARLYYEIKTSFSMKNTGVNDVQYPSAGITIPSEENLDLVRYFQPIGTGFNSSTYFLGGLNYGRNFITDIVIDSAVHNKGDGKLEPFARRNLGAGLVTVVRDLNNNGKFESIKGWNLWSSFAEEPLGGGASAENPYLIATPQNLAWITSRARYGTAFPNETYFKLTADIDLSGHIWDQIGTYSMQFNGIFNFDRYSITNMTLEIGSINVGDERTQLFGSVSYLGRILNFVPSTYWAADGNFAIDFQFGNGTALTPYQIRTGAELARILRLSKDGNTFRDVYFVLMSNIDLSKHRWEKILDFGGYFNYNGFVINNIDLGQRDGGVEPLDRWELFEKRIVENQVFPSKSRITNWNLWTSFATTSFAGGSGSINDPFQISNAGQLAYLAKRQNEDASFSQGKYFVLTSSIDLAGHLWVQIGSLNKEFTGQFDYNRKSVKNILLEANPQNNTKEKELFGGDMVTNNLKNWVPSEYWSASVIGENLSLEFSGGSGTQTDPYIIGNPLAFFNQLFTDANNTRYFRLNSINNTINMDGYLWKSITFHGNLDANRVQITNIKQNIEDGAGFFSEDSSGIVINWSPIQSWNSPDLVTPILGTGSELDPFLISSATQLAYVMRDINYNNFNSKGKHYVLTRSINLVNNYWEPIGTNANKFKGRFDAKDFTVFNISVSTEAQRSGKMLFGEIDDATFVNINQKSYWADSAYRSGSYSSGNGTAASPYVIKTASELALLSYQTNNVAYFTLNKHFVLGSDISLVNHAWEPIGVPAYQGEVADRVFSGTFDYAGFEVTNIYYEGSDLVNHLGTKYELFNGLSLDIENNVTAQILRWIPTENWIDNVGQVAFVGSGTEEDPFQIGTPDDLAFLSKAFTSDQNNAYWNMSYKLIENIDLSGYLWTPIGTNAYPFNGNFFGNGYTVSGIVMTEGVLGGLFGVVKNLSKTVKIENFEISNVNIRLNALEGTRTSIGLLAAITENTELKNIKTSGIVNSDSILPFSVGGLIGYATTTKLHATISVAELNITQKSPQAKITQVGGLVGHAYNVSIYNSYFAGKLSATVAAGSATGNTLSVGGLHGFVRGNASDSRHYNSFATGLISVSVPNGVVAKMGGVVGEINPLSTERPFADQFSNLYFLSSSTFNANLNAFGSTPTNWILPTKIYKKDNAQFFQTRSTYTNAANWKNEYHWNFSDTWNNVVDERREYPSLQSFGEYFVVINNSGVVGGRLHFETMNGIIIEDETENSQILQRKYRFEDKVGFYVEVDAHYIYSRIVKKDGITLQNVIQWKTKNIDGVDYLGFDIVVNANWSGSYSVEFATASYKLNLRVETLENQETGGYIRFESSDRFVTRDYNITFNSNVTLIAESKPDYIFAGWYVLITDAPDDYVYDPEDPESVPFEPYYELVADAGANFKITMPGKEITYLATFTKDISILTIKEIGGAGGIYYFGNTNLPATGSVGKMQLNREGKIKVEVKEGYTFLGWFTSEEADAEPISTELEYQMLFDEETKEIFARFLPPVVEEEEGFPWWIVFVGGGGALLLSGIVLLTIKKKRGTSRSYRNNFRF